MAVFKCKMCGAPINVSGNETVITCEYCGRTQTLPKLNDEKRVQLYDRANHFRRNNEFDKASAIYEQILLEDNTDAESYWSLVLCKYGIEYVEDALTRKRIPTVNRMQYTSIYDDDNYKSAIGNADLLQKSVYEEEARAINEIQKGILAISQKEEPFDVFICYKETDSDGRRTPDSVLATELYQQLTKEGFKVFFARITLESKLGTAYEPYIFAALNSSKVMVVIGTKPEYFNAVWVKNEWSRYLALIKNGAEKLLIPAYRDMDPYDLPDEFSHLQAQDMGKLGFMQDLTYGITKIVRPKTAQQTVVVESAQSNNSNVTALLKRAFMFLEDKDWHSASEYCEKVLDIEPENAEAYLAKLMVELKVNVRERLNTCEQPFNRSTNYIKAVRFGSPALKEELDGYNREISNRNNDIAYKKAMSLMEQADSETLYKNAAEAFRKIASYRDSDVLAKQCFDRAEVCRKDRIYEEASNRMQNNSIHSYEKAINGFNLIRGWKDSDSQIMICKESMNALIYDEAIEAMNIQSVTGYDTAINKFARISGWKDADEQIETCNKRKQALLKNEIYEAATELMKKDSNNSYHSAIERFREIPGWRDADELIKICERRIEANKAKAEAERIAKEKAEERERKAKKRKKTTKRLIAVVIVLAIISGIGFAVASKVYFKPLGKYNEAIELQVNGEFSKAIELFSEIPKFKDSTDRIMECSYSIAEGAYANADGSVVIADLANAAIALGKCGDYKDAREKSFELWDKIAERKTIVATANHTIALKNDGSVVATGANDFGECNVRDWTDIIAVDTNRFSTVGLKADGTILLAGKMANETLDSKDWSDIVAVCLYGDFEDYLLGLKSDGTVVSAGYPVRGFEKWTNIIAIALNGDNIYGLRLDGTVECTDTSESVYQWEDIVAISANYRFVLGLKKDGSVVYAGNPIIDQDKFGSNLNEVIAISAGDVYNTVGNSCALCLMSDGSVISFGNSTLGRCDVSEWYDVIAVSAGETHSVGLKSDGTVFATGNNDNGQCDVSDWTNIKIPSKTVVSPSNEA